MLAVSIVAGCNGSIRWPGDERSLRPEPAASMYAANTRDPSIMERRWFREVETAAKLWNDAAVKIGCGMVFVVSTSGEHPVRLFMRNDWPWEPWTVGMTVGGGHGTIDVLDRSQTRPSGNIPTLLHEMGHALGLEHDIAWDGVMRYSNSRTTISEQDAAALAAVGC